MKVRVFDCKKLDYTGEIGKKEDLIKKYPFEEYEDILFLPFVEETENEITFDEWLKEMFDLESDIEKGCKDSEEELYKHQINFPKFFDIWHNALFERL